jgi:hypothetical protein
MRTYRELFGVPEFTPLFVTSSRIWGLISCPPRTTRAGRSRSFAAIGFTAFSFAPTGPGPQEQPEVIPAPRNALTRQ